MNEENSLLKYGLAQMLKGGVIMDVTNVEQALIAEEAGACAVMALERVPSDIRKHGGIARMANPRILREIKEAVSIPVMAKCRIGHTIEARIIESCGIDFIDESEVLTPADEYNYVSKKDFKVPFVSGCRNLLEALKRISEGASMIRTKGQAGTGDIREAVIHANALKGDIMALQTFNSQELSSWLANAQISDDLLKNTFKSSRLPVVTFAAGGIATPADASLMMNHGMDGIFVGSV